MKRLIGSALVLGLASLCLGPSAAATKGPAAGKTVTIGVIADVTGSAAVYGTMQKNAYELANDDVKTGEHRCRRRQPVVRRRGCRQRRRQVVNLMQKFTTDGSTPLVLGPTLSGEALPCLSDRQGRELPGHRNVDDGRRRDRHRSDRLPRSRWPNRKRSRRPSPKCSNAGTPRRSRSSTATTTRSPKPTATCSAREFEKSGAHGRRHRDLPHRRSRIFGLR